MNLSRSLALRSILGASAAVLSAQTDQEKIAAHIAEHGVTKVDPKPSPQNTEETLSLQTIDPADPVIKRMNAWLAAVPLFIDNGYTTRAMYYAVASACTRQVEFIEERLQRGNAAKLRSLLNTATAVSNGQLSEDDSTATGAAGVSEYSIDEQIAEVERRMQQNENSVQEMNALKAVAIKHHDLVSIDLNLPTWSAISAGGTNKAAAQSGRISPQTAALLARLDSTPPKQQARR